MPVSAAYRDYVLEQLGRVVTVTHRSMFGGVGLYAEGLFFGLMDDDTLYLKVDETNRPDFEAMGAEQFRPGGEGTPASNYYRLPEDLLEDPDTLRPWVERALQVARRATRGKRPRRR